MQVSTVELPKTAGKGSANSKKTSAKGFGDILQDFEEKGGAAQLLAGLGLGMQIPQQMLMQGQQNIRQNQADTAQISNMPIIEELSQVPQGGFLITGLPNNAGETDGAFANVLQDTSAGMELPPQGDLQIPNIETYGIQQAADLGQEEVASPQKSDTAAVPKAQTTPDTKAGAERIFAQSAAGAMAAETAATVKTASDTNTVFSMTSGTAPGTAAVKADAAAAVSQAGSMQANLPPVQTAGISQGSFDSQLNTAVSSGQTAAESAADIQAGAKTTDIKAFADESDKDGTSFKVQDTSQQTLEVKITPSKQDKSQQTALSAKDLAETDNGNEDTLNNNTDINDNFNIALTQQSRIESSDSVDQTLKADTANQVADAVKQAYDNGRSEIRLHLSPEDLGGINIRLISQGGVLTLRITADNQHTGQLLASGMHELTQSLQNLGITMDKAEVSYTGFSGFDSTASQQQQQQNFGSQSYHLPKWVPAMQNVGDIIPPAASEQTDLYMTNTSGLSILA